MSITPSCNRQQTMLLMVEVEDDDTDATAIERALRRLRLRNPVRRAGTIPHPFMILLDLNMPRMGGLECLQAIGLIDHYCSIAELPVPDSGWCT